MKTHKLENTISRLNKERLGHLKGTNRSENATSMYKKYRKNKQANKIEYPEKIKTADGQTHDIEIGYSKYLSDKLMKAIAAEVPHISPNQNIQTETGKDTNPINRPNILNTIHNLNKDKSSGLSGIPVRYYHWGGSPMIELLYTWYKTMQQFNYVPWNLKIDMKMPFPKFNNEAPRITKQDPAQYRPIALQNSMYKILDGCIKINLESHDQKHQMIYKNQGGFKKKEGTIEHLYVAQTAFNYNKKLYSAFLDLQKAYDSVWRQALFQKLHKQYKVPQQTVQLIEAMYHNTWSCTRVKATISTTFQTHNGLQQGALSSPILFNYYINGLIDLLNKATAGINIGRIKINNLLFADDIMIMTKTKRDLQQLLHLCSAWANKWKLRFSLNKSKTLTNQDHKIGPLKLQGHDMLETEDRTYKYLGIPFTKTGIDVHKYYRHIKRNMRIALQEMTIYCERQQISYKNRILLYKTTIRSQIE